MVRKLLIGSLLICLLGVTTTSSAINIVLDYSHDSFFGSHPVAKAALEAAAADLSNSITTNLSGTVDSNTSNVNGSFATVDFSFNYDNPTTGANVDMLSAVIPANQVRVFVGMRNLFGNTLGEGGPGGGGFEVGGSYLDFGDFTTAVNNTMAAGNANMSRGGGPTILNLNGNVGGIPYSLNFGLAVGNLWFDQDSNNDNIADSDTVLNNYFHFDHTTAVAAGKNDFYSIALHELVHSVGVGTSLSWDDLVSNADSRDWLGAEVIGQLGSGDDVLLGGATHIAEGRMSMRVADGIAQEAVMDPTITVGTRKQLTNLDLAFLRDIGWQTIDYFGAMGQPGDFDGDGDVDGADFVVWQTNFPTAGGASLATGDADGDGDVDGADFVVWQTNFPLTPGSGVSQVPEPASWFAALFAVAAVVAAKRRGQKGTARLGTKTK